MPDKSPSFWRTITLAVAVVLAIAGLSLTQVGQAQTGSDWKVDHTLFPALQGPFARPQDVTKACLSCHEDAAQQIMHTYHWTWEFVNETTGQTLGKKTLINNFCIGIQSNEPRCTSCHAGYGWKDKDFDFTVEENVDCLVCHDTTGNYKKFPTGAGLPVSEPKEFPAGSGTIWEPPNLEYTAQKVGLSSRLNCGACHFYGGGADGVKHGDLDSSLTNPPITLDVHMSPEGQDFTCTNCHTTVDHEIAGSRYGMDPETWKGCEGCHTNAPHKLTTLNRHTDRVACQTCHIPEFARGGVATKMTWDWSKAGELDAEGKPVIRKDEAGHIIYDGQKGEFTVGENMIPEYVWFNGQVEYTLAGETIDPNATVPINRILGSKDDPQARVFPVKRFEAVQPYDKVNNTLVIPHLFGQDEFAYWKNYDWQKAISFGMEYAGLPYSGEYGFVSTVMYWPISHMVAPPNQALVCKDCHTAETSRVDFQALGYDETEAKRLTNFPPQLTIELLNQPEYSAASCATCHPVEQDLWMNSRHGTQSVGCISCHQPVGEGEHPTIAYTMDRSAETCGACHLKEYDDWKESIHSQVQVSCASCHNPHSQQIMTIENNKTACETCHRGQKEQLQHSTHFAAGLTCKECHRNTDQSTGHSFTVASDTCLKCHSDGIHNASLIVDAGLPITQIADIGQAPPEAAPAAEPEAEPAAETGGAGIILPGWLLLVGGVIIGAGVNWLLSTSRLADDRKTPSEPEVEEDQGETTVETEDDGDELE